MRKKALTKQCPSCNECSINNENNFICNWGNSKIPKILLEPKGKMKDCTLKGK